MAPTVDVDAFAAACADDVMMAVDRSYEPVSSGGLPPARQAAARAAA